jgi:DNA primase
VLPENTDPDEFVREHGADAFRGLLERRISPTEYQLSMIFDAHAHRGPDGAVTAAREAVEILLRIEDWPRRDEFLARAADIWGRGDPGRTESMTRVLKFEMTRQAHGRAQTRGSSQRDPGFITETLTRAPAGLLRAESELLALALDDTETCMTVIAQLQPADMLLETDAAILCGLQEQIATTGEPDAAALAEGLPEEGGARRRCVELTVSDVRLTARESEDDRAAQTLETIRRLRAHRRLGGAPAARICDLPDDEEAAIVEDFQQLQRMVAEGIESGELSPDDPLVVKYRDACRRARGASGRGFVGDAQLRERLRGRHDDWKPPTGEELAALQRSSAATSGSVADEHSAAPTEHGSNRPPADDPFEVEDGDPFADDDD